MCYSVCAGICLSAFGCRDDAVLVSRSNLYEVYNNGMHVGSDCVPPTSSVQLSEHVSPCRHIAICSMSLQESARLSSMGVATSSWRPVRPPSCVVLGGPRSGKSQTWKALSWFAFQHDIGHRVAVVAYAWRAARFADTDAHMGCTTTTFLKLGSYTRKYPKGFPVDPDSCAIRESNLKDLWVLVVDEIGTTGLEHLSVMEKATRATMQSVAPDAETSAYSGYAAEAAWGNLGIVTLGDLDQLDPVGHMPLYKIPLPHRQQAVAGHEVWRGLRHVFLFDNQHRFDLSTAGGRQLHRWAKMWGSDQPDPPGSTSSTTTSKHRTRGSAHDEMRHFCEAINLRALGPGQLEGLIPHDPKVIVLRNRVRWMLNQRIPILVANHKGKRIIAWRSDDARADGAKITSVEELWLTQVPPDDTCNVGPMLLFFDGIDYLFGDSKAQNMGRFKNGICVGRGLMLDEREPPDSGNGPVWMLRYMPLAVYVQAKGRDLGNFSRGRAGVPPGCFPVCPTTISTVPRTATGSRAPSPPTFTLSNGSKVKGFFIKRTGFALCPAYALTDFCVQGATLTNATWLLHLSPPTDGRLSRAAVLVCITRFPDADSVRLLCPLWAPDASEQEIEAVVGRFRTACVVKAELVAEMKRIKIEAARTLDDLAPLRSRTFAAVAARRDQIAHTCLPDV